MEQKTKHRIELHFMWGNAEMVLGSFKLPCWVVYELLHHLTKNECFTDDWLKTTAWDVWKYEANRSDNWLLARFVASQLCEHNILSFDHGSNSYERGEHFQDYEKFFEDFVQSWKMTYSLSNGGYLGYYCTMEQRELY